MADVIPGIHHQENNCKFFTGRNEIGIGVFYITENNVLWKQSNSDKCVSLSYKNIGVHAVSRDTRAFPHECLYIMYNGDVPDLEKENEHSNEEEEEEEECQKVTEIRIVPENVNNIKRMYDKMSDCQCLHPDDEDSDDSMEPNHEEIGGGDMGANGNGVPTRIYEDGAGEGFYTTEEGFDHLTAQGQETLQRLQEMLNRSQITPNSQNGTTETDDPPVESQNNGQFGYPTNQNGASGFEHELLSEQNNGQFDDA